MNALMMYLSGSVGGAVVNVLLAFVCVYPGKHEKDQFFQVLDTQKWRKFHLNIVRTMAAKLLKGWFVYQLLPKVVCCIYKTAHSVGNLLEWCYVCNIQCGHTGWASDISNEAINHFFTLADKLHYLNLSNIIWYPRLYILLKLFTINWMSSIRQYGLVFSLCVFTNTLGW